MRDTARISGEKVKYYNVQDSLSAEEPPGTNLSRPEVDYVCHSMMSDNGEGVAYRKDVGSHPQYEMVCDM